MKRKLSDLANLASKITFKKTVNAFNVWYGFIHSKYRKTPLHPGFPISLSIEPTTSCNLRCPECPSGLRAFTRPTGMLSTNLFQQIITELKETLCYLTFYFQGEPFLHPSFLDMVKYASDQSIYTATSTNAHYLSKENAEETVRSGLDRLIISIDGTTQETYAAYRVGGQLEKVIEGTKNVLEARKRLASRTPYVVFQFLVVRPNEHQLAEIQQLADELGVDELVFKTAQVYFIAVLP